LTPEGIALTSSISTIAARVLEADDGRLFRLIGRRAKLFQNDNNHQAPLGIRVLSIDEPLWPDQRIVRRDGLTLQPWKRSRFDDGNRKGCDERIGVFTHTFDHMERSETGSAEFFDHTGAQSPAPRTLFVEEPFFQTRYAIYVVFLKCEISNSPRRRLISTLKRLNQQSTEVPG
jgi:hypothetical protein